MGSDKKVAGHSASKGIQSVEIGYRLLKPFMSSPGPFSLKNLAVEAGMTPAKAHFYAVSLMRVGLLTRDTSRGMYSLGPTILHLGLAALAQSDVIQAAQEPMQDLRNQLGAPTFLSVWAENGPTIVQNLHGLRSTSWAMQVGAVLPPLSATGRALLAYHPQALQRTIIERELTLARAEDPWYDMTVDDVMKVLSEIRESGISLRSGIVVPGFASVAAAIIDHEGEAAAAITIIGDARNFDDRPDGKYAKALRATTRDITYIIGGQVQRVFDEGVHKKKEIV
jgi:DNA-binding IclR family transcriptional regulator